MMPESPSPPTPVDDARYRLLVDSVQDYAIFVLDPAGHIGTWNAGAQRLKGYSAAEIIGRHFSVFYQPEEVQSGKCERELEVATREGRYEEEGWRVRKDGSLFWASVTITALREPSGNMVGFAKVTRDLTERRAAEEEARRFQVLIDTVKDYAIFILTPEGYVDSWNSGAERLKGYTASEIIGQHFSVFYRPEEIAKCAHELAEAARLGRFEDEGLRVRKDGSTFWANVIVTALHNPAGALIGYAKVTRDLSERRAAEERHALLAAETARLAEAARIQEFQERFIAILGHDLRNPLAAIEMGLGLLRRPSTSVEATTRVVQRMEASAARMGRMIEQILDLTRSRLAGGLLMSPKAMDLQDMLRRIIDELGGAHPARAIVLRCPPVEGVWDVDRLEQVFSNLIGNAVHHGEGGPIDVDVTVDAGSVGIEVHNFGPPISEALQAEIFNPFRRGERDSRTSVTAGLGLGLYISHEIVAAHGGTLAVRSSAEGGTTFRVTLPITPVHHAA